MQTRPYTGVRGSIAEFIHVGSRVNPIFITAEINAAKLQTYCRSQSVTLTPALIRAIVHVVRDNPLMNSFLGRNLLLRRTICLYDTVDIMISVEKEYRGERFVSTPILRQVDGKSMQQISADLQQIAQTPYHEREDIKPILLFNTLPAFAKYLVLRSICQSPRLFRRFFGPIGFTNLGAHGVSYLYPLWLNTIVFGFGSIERKPVADGDRIEIAPVLPVSLAFNHSVLDGCEASRILASFRRCVEQVSFAADLS